MTIQRLENVGIVVEDLAAATAFFVELGLKVLGKGPVEGDWADRVVGLDGVRVDVAMLETLDGHGWLGLMKFHAPPARGGDRDAPANTLGIRRIAFAAPTARRRRCSSRGRIAQRDGGYRPRVHATRQPQWRVIDSPRTSWCQRGGPRAGVGVRGGTGHVLRPATRTPGKRSAWIVRPG
jgi:catechol 2,3-dioxygenase-like lactoylglutathione lyase family enzyme